jgi:hypothetical protein
MKLLSAIPSNRFAKDLGHCREELARIERLRDEPNAPGATERVRMLSGRYRKSDDRNSLPD